MARKIGIGIIGCGKISDPHVTGYLKIPSKARIVAVCDSIPEVANAKAEFLGVKAYYDIHDLLKLQDVDIVDILLPHNLHAGATIAAAEAGKHVICEKPMATTLSDADKMIKAAESNNTKLMISHNWRFMPHLETIKNFIDRGLMGKLVAVKIEAAGFQEYPSGHWRLSLSKSGGGVFIVHGVHHCDLLRWLAGQEVEEISTVVGNLFHTTWELEDTSISVLRFRNGIIGTLYESLGEKRPYFDERYNIVGTSGSALADLVTGTASMYSDQIPQALRGWSAFSFGNQYENSVARTVEHFVDCVMDDKEPVVTGEDGKAAMKIVLAGYLSAKLGKTVKLQNFETQTE